uniref:MSV199 domain-containing protein n=1 Tax=viral metagenome TaxID=1070528 RepID=A0A6C0IDI4_9ZZZZ
MDTSLNFVALVETSPITRLNHEYNNKFINKIKETFTETQQQLFVSSLYCFLNYHPTNDYVIDLDNVWQWLGFSQKVNAKTCIEKYFVIDKDYKIILNPHLREQKVDGRGGHNKQTIILNVKTFKMLCIKADTKKSNEIHEYFIKLEELLQLIVQEESDELKRQLQQKDAVIQQNESEKNELATKLSQSEEDNRLLQKRDNVPMIYIYNIDTRAEKPELKIGYSINLHSRIKPYKQICKYGKIEFTVEIFNQNVKTVENFIHHALSKYQIKDEVFRLGIDEAKMMVLRIVNTIKLCNITNEGERQLKLAQLYEHELEVVDNAPKVKVATREMGTQTDDIIFDPPTMFPTSSSSPENVVISTMTEALPPVDERTQSFNQFIDTHCIVRPDVEVSTTDIVGQYRILAQSASKEVYHALISYLDTRFTPGRLKHQNQKNVINGYSGVMLREIEYKKSIISSDVQNFIHHACVFSPSGKTLFSDLLEEYKQWKKTVQKPETKTEAEELKKYLKETKYVLYTTIWANNGGGQGYYGILLKSENYAAGRTTSTTGKKVEKRIKDTNEILSTWDTIAKAAEAEKICAAKMSRSIKSGVVFPGNYYYSIAT